jgi:hypothetical protein
VVRNMSTAPALPIAVAVGDQCRKAINVAMMSSAPRITDRFGRKVIAVEWVTGLDSGTGRQPVSAAPARDTCPEYSESLQGCSATRGLGLHLTRTFSPAIGIRELVGSWGGRVERGPSSLSTRLRTAQAAVTSYCDVSRWSRPRRIESASSLIRRDMIPTECRVIKGPVVEFRWPIRAEAYLFDRLSTMPLRIEYNESASRDAWRADSPAVLVSDPRPSWA